MAIPEEDVTYTALKNDDTSTLQEAAETEEFFERSSKLVVESDEEAERQKVEQHEFEMRLAGAKLIGGLRQMTHFRVKVEEDSIYGAALLVPQLARSLNWPRELFALTVTSYIALILCVVLHGYVLMFVAKEERVIDDFSGKMYLCDFGASIDLGSSACGDDGCPGPGGTPISAPRLYNFPQWAVHNFVFDSLMAVFPESHSHISSTVDVGEYGQESYFCRILCIVVFLISIGPEALTCVDIAKLLWYVPPVNQSWVKLKAHGEADESSLLEDVKVKVAGMSRFWKLINFFVLFLPKTILVFSTAKAGSVFLMNTAGITNLIVNSVALNFLLDLDNLMTHALMDAGTLRMLEMVEDMDLEGHDGGNGDDEEDKAASRSKRKRHVQIQDRSKDTEMIERIAQEQHLGSCASFWRLLVNVLYHKLYNLLMVCAMMLFLMANYYTTHCEPKQGQMVSKPLYPPLSMNFDLLHFFLSMFFPLPVGSNYSWKMP
eukprot:TRINITY_DN47567_c0_g1_i1.p1 TRINITY_DN47567_c0_g1~~TRINITY_DN47567_c0_g1_i1.p1  ORF type:complete len:489 (-),score=75.81 TRINITY_DN47567_c0_g1_i1:74-1540(-)